MKANSVPENWPLDDQQRQVLETGKPPELVMMPETLPPAEQFDILDTFPNGQRQRPDWDRPA